MDRKHTLDQVFKELQDEMRSQYSIAYTPTNEVKDGGYRHLEIRLANKDLKAQARKGYYAIKPETTLGLAVTRRSSSTAGVAVRLRK